MTATNPKSGRNGKSSNGKSIGIVLGIVLLLLAGAAIWFFVSVNRHAEGIANSMNADPTVESDATATGESTEDPLPLGTPISVDDWTVTVHGVDLDATEAVMAENDANRVPEEGQKYIAADVSVTYSGSSPEGAVTDAEIRYETGEKTSTIFHYDAAAPNQLDLGSTLHGGDTIRGNMAFLVPADTADQGAIWVRVNPSSKAKFVSVQ